MNASGFAKKCKKSWFQIPAASLIRKNIWIYSYTKTEISMTVGTKHSCAVYPVSNEKYPNYESSYTGGLHCICNFPEHPFLTFFFFFQILIVLPITFTLKEYRSKKKHPIWYRMASLSSHRFLGENKMYKWCSQGFGMRPCYEIWNPLDYSEAATLANRSKLNLVPISWEKIKMKSPCFGPLIQLEWHQIKILLVNIISASSTSWVPLLHWYCSCDPEWLVWHCCCAEQKSKKEKNTRLACWIYIGTLWRIMFQLWMREIYIHIEDCINIFFFFVAWVWCFTPVARNLNDWTKRWKLLVLDYSVE